MVVLVKWRIATFYIRIRINRYLDRDHGFKDKDHQLANAME